MNESTTESPKSRAITELTSQEARAFLMQSKSYTTLDLPEYVDFGPLLAQVSDLIRGDNQLAVSRKARRYDNVNYSILCHKGGIYGWRPLELIHPYLYVSLVDLITESNHWNSIKSSFAKSAQRSLIESTGIPRVPVDSKSQKATQVSSWWERFEQRSIASALEYEFVAVTDLVDCYPSIYTHSVAWSLLGKKRAQGNKRGRRELGNLLDGYLMDMHRGQTNGIPQGSVLSDLIAELVLSYLDRLVSCYSKMDRLNGFRILRYRDDYRIFARDLSTATGVLKALSRAVAFLGLKLNVSKTIVSDDVITNAVKDDKVAWLLKRPRRCKLYDGLIDIRQHVLSHPDTGSVRKALTEYWRRLKDAEYLGYDTASLASIALDIGLRSPSAFPQVVAILSELLDRSESESCRRIVNSAIRKLSLHPNTGHMEIWLQRLVRKTEVDCSFEEKLCHKVDETETTIWNSDWIDSPSLKDIVDRSEVIDQRKFEEMDLRFSNREVDLFFDSGY